MTGDEEFSLIKISFIVMCFRFEDGTMPFLEILSLRHGFAALNRLGRSMESIQLHTFTLAKSVMMSHECRVIIM